MVKEAVLKIKFKKMKKLVVLCATALLFVNCSKDAVDGKNGTDGTDGKNGINGTNGVNITGKIYDVTNFNFFKVSDVPAGNFYSINITFNTPIGTTDAIIAYRLDGIDNQKNPVWVTMPRSYTVPEGGFTYDYAFSKSICFLQVFSNFDLGTTPAYINNQNVRILVVPAAAARNSKMLDYKSAIKLYKIDESKVEVL
jgi:hypothetical protein